MAFDPYMPIPPRAVRTYELPPLPGPRRMSYAFHPLDKSSPAMFARSYDAIADRNAAFMEMLNHPTNPLTSRDIFLNWRRAPERWAAYLSFIPPADLIGFMSRY